MGKRRTGSRQCILLKKYSSYAPGIIACVEGDKGKRGWVGGGGCKKERKGTWSFPSLPNPLSFFSSLLLFFLTPSSPPPPPHPAAFTGQTNSHPMDGINPGEPRYNDPRYNDVFRMTMINREDQGEEVELFWLWKQKWRTFYSFQE